MGVLTCCRARDCRQEATGTEWSQLMDVNEESSGDDKDDDPEK